MKRCLLPLLFILLFHVSFFFSYAGNCTVETDTLTAVSHWNIAQEHYTSARYDSAIVHFEQAGKIYLDATASTRYLASLYFKGKCHEWLGNYAESNCLADSIVMGCQNNPTLPPALKSYAYQLYAEVQFHNLDFGEAIHQLEVAKEACIQQYGYDHPSVSKIDLHLAKVYIEIDDFRRATESLNAAWTSLQTNPEKWQPEIGIWYRLKAIILIREENVTAGKKALDTALTILLTHFGELHPEVAMCYYNSSHNRSANERKLRYQKALHIAQDVFGDFHPMIGKCWLRIADANKASHNLDSCWLPIRKAQHILKQTHSYDLLAQAHVMETLAHCYQYFDSDSSLFYAQHSLTKYRQVYGEQHSDVARAYTRISIEYSAKGEHKIALDGLEKAKKIMEKLHPLPHPEMSFIYLRIGITYKNLGNPGKGLGYAEMATQNMSKKLGKDDSRLAYFHAMTGSIAKELQEYERALGHFTAMVRLYSDASYEDQIQLALCYYKIGFLHLIQKKYADAYHMANKSLKIRQAKLGDTHPWTGVTYILLASILSKQHQHDAAHAMVMKGANSLLAGYGKKSPRVCIDYNNISIILSEIGENEEALEFNQICISASMVPFTEEELSFTPSYQEVISPLGLLSGLETKANLHLEISKHISESTTLKEHLLIALRMSEYGVNFIDTLQARTSPQNSKQILLSKFFNLYQSGIMACRELYELTGDATYLKKAWQFAEKSNAFALLENLQQEQIRKFSEIPVDLLEEADALQENLRTYEKGLLNAKIAQDTAQQEQMYSALFTARNRYDSLLAQFESAYPRYYGLKYNKAMPHLDSIRDQLSPGTAFLEFFEGGKNNDELETSLYIFLITKDTISLRTLPIDSLLNQNLDALKTTLSPQGRYPQDKTHPLRFPSLSYRLYQKLLEPEVSSLPPEIHRLIVVPCHRISSIPMEVLLTHQPAESKTYSSLPYLLKKYSIQYAFSAHLLFREHENNAPSLTQVFAFTPTFPNSSNKSSYITGLRSIPSENMSQLPGAAKEAFVLAKYFNGKIFAGEHATERNFIEQASQADLLHLATHASSDSLNPYNSSLAFTAVEDSLYDGFLSANEIYNLRLNAKLAVLSACLTAKGKVETGQGALSLAHAFSFAGCPSILSSLWAVNDQSTLKIMEGYYAHLATGIPKDEALRQAKLTYLETQGAYASHPFYWAAFIGIGDPAPLVWAKEPLFSWRGVLCLCLVVAGFLGFRFRKLVR